MRRRTPSYCSSRFDLWSIIFSLWSLVFRLWSLIFNRWSAPHATSHSSEFYFVCMQPLNWHWLERIIWVRSHINIKTHPNIFSFLGQSNRYPGVVYYSIQIQLFLRNPVHGPPTGTRDPREERRSHLCLECPWASRSAPRSVNYDLWSLNF